MASFLSLYCSSGVCSDCSVLVICGGRAISSGLPAKQNKITNVKAILFNHYLEECYIHDENRFSIVSLSEIS